MSQFTGDPLAGGLLSLGGAALSAFGGVAPGRDNRRTRDMFYQTEGRPRMENLQAMYGNDADLAAARLMLGPEWRQSQDMNMVLAQMAPGRTAEDLARFETQNPGYVQSQGDLINAMTQRQTGNLNYFDQQAGNIENSIYGNDAALMNAYGRERGKSNKMYNQSTNQVADVYRGYGRDMEKSIREDLALANQSAQAQQLAAASRRGGMTSSDQVTLAGIQAQNNRNANSNIADVRQRGAELYGGALASGFAQRNAAASGLMQNQLNMEQNRAASREGFLSNRLSARMNLENANLANDFQARTSFNQRNQSSLNDIANASRMQPLQYQTQNAPLDTIGQNLQGVGGLLLGDWYNSSRSQQQYNPADPYGTMYGPPNPNR